MKPHLLPTEKSQKEFYQHYHDKGTIVMLNMLKYRKVADYANAPALDPGHEISGQEAYQLYSAATLPLVHKAGGEVVYLGTSDSFLIGPVEEHWDAILLVRYPSAEKFIAFAGSEEYLKTAGHRTAALEDSRLLPTAQPSA